MSSVILVSLALGSVDRELASRSLSACSTVTSSTTAPAPAPSGKADSLPTESILSPYELSFGAICGICAGIFIKKGAKLIAFFLGGTYVLMQVRLRARAMSCLY